MNLLFHTAWKLLTFRISRKEISEFAMPHFLLGLFGTWIVGMGRYWDDSGAILLQHIGLGSVIYIFVLSAIIWLIVKPFRVKRWNYFRVLTFVSLTSFPAVFYAIPVEKFVSLPVANKINVWFLAVVALWRLLLLFYFLRVFAQLSRLNVFTLALMPMCAIISVLTMLNLHRVVFNIMGGVRNATPHDDAYTVLMGLTVVSMIMVIPLIVLYVHGIIKIRRPTST